MNTIIDELTKKYGYEFGDLIENPWTVPYLPGKIILESIKSNLLDPFFQDEPFWLSNKERNNDYETVTRMFLGIPEWSSEDMVVDYGCQNWVGN